MEPCITSPSSSGAGPQNEQEFVGRLYPDAEACVKRATELDPRFGNAWLNLSNDAGFNGNARLADNAFRKALQFDGDKYYVYEWGLQLFQPKWNDEPNALAQIAGIAANTDYDTADHTTAIADDLNEAGFSRQGQALTDRYIAQLTKRVSQSPGDGEACYALAKALRYAGQRQQALAACQSAVKLLPLRPDIGYELGRILDDGTTWDDVKAAMAEYRKVITIDPDSRCHCELGYDLKRMGQFSEAETELQTYIRLYPFRAQGYFALGELYGAEHKNDQAIPEFEKALVLSPYYTEAYDAVVQLLDEAGRYDEALKYGKQALEIYDTDSVLVDDLADVYLNKKQWQRSERLSNYALSLNANDALAHENLGEAEIGMGEKDKAHEEWNTVIRLNDPNFTGVARKMLAKYP